ncbi:hypothetical protein VNO78_19519 [Psophocarpus tetragonolobus]|uniref:Transmembrane protein n=1 Tax=Psophocarpus tetragonolobus TaxID=3891 RepID=A0AAN9S9K9_PSOTE
MVVELVLLYKKALLHTSLSLIVGLSLGFLKIPLLFLNALQTYIHPDSQAQSSGLRAAIRRPGLDPLSSAELKKRNKSKLDFDENNAQIFRITLDHSHLLSRLFVHHYSLAFTLSFAALFSLFLHTFLQSPHHTSFFSLPLLLSILTLYIWAWLLAKLTFERSASTSSQKQFSFLFCLFGLFLGLFFLPDGLPFLFDFPFRAPIHGFWRLFVALWMGCLAGVLFIPASRSARCFWIGTDQIRCNLSMITCSWFPRSILYANQLFVLFVAFLWITPLADIFVNNMANTEHADVVFLPSDFHCFRKWCLLVSSLLQILALRPNMQMYLNEALLSWYQRLHASKVPDLDYSRAKMFLHNHYLCLVVLQFLAPPVLVLLFLGLSQIHGVSFGNFTLLPSFALFNELALFFAWWVTFLWALFSSVILLLHRHCVLYVS